VDSHNRIYISKDKFGGSCATIRSHSTRLNPAHAFTAAE
jgi:hypothetical protein